MRQKSRTKFILALILISGSHLSLLAQNTSSSSDVFPLSIAIIIGVLVLAVVLLFAESFIQIETQKRGLSPAKSKGVLGQIRKMTQPKLPEFVPEQEVHILKDGFDIRLEGAAPNEILEGRSSSRFAVQPPNFRGIAPIPKLVVEVGSEVLAGDEVFFDKSNPAIKYVAPVSGEVVEINRGAKRAISEIVILADKEQRFKILPAVDLSTITREELVKHLQAVGFWTMITERPFDVVPGTDTIPENIFISTFDSAPNGPDRNYQVEGKEALFQQGLDTLQHLTSGSVHLGLNAKVHPADGFLDATGVEKHWFHGPHPAGNVGVQIHHIDAIGRGEKVWVLDVQNVILLGSIISEKRYDTSRKVAITGASSNGYVNTYIGAHLGELLKGEDLTDKRIVSGDLLSGKAKSESEYLNTMDDQISIVEEGDNYDMFGWLIPSKANPSVSRSYPNFLFPDMQFKPDTNTHGEKRAFVVTDQYEKLLPMDIYPQILMKAILATDFERMEGLGIYELSEEDVALCEFACTSKSPLQQILRQGLDVMREQA